MAKKAVKPIQNYSSSDQCLIALLSEPVKRYKIKHSFMTKIKQNDESLQSIISNEILLNVSTSSSSTV